MAQRMLARAREAGVPAAWVTGDAVYGNDRRLRIWLEEQRQGFVLERACKEPFWAWQATKAGRLCDRMHSLPVRLPNLDGRAA
jgi:SRSO17 transposase